MSKQINRLKKAFFDHTDTKEQKYPTFSGLLGVTIDGAKTVEVPDRLGYVYVRLRDNLNELVQVFNDKVSPVYDLPVLITKDKLDRTRYRVVSRDYERYRDWGISPFLPRHGNQHSFTPDSGGGGDIVWVYTDQFIPFLVTPSGTAGAGNVLVCPGIYQYDDGFHYAGDTGTASLYTCKPTGSSNAGMALVYLDISTGNPMITCGTEEFSLSISGTANLLEYIPPAPLHGVPLAGVRLITGTSTIGWNDLIDLREFVDEHPAESWHAYGGFQDESETITIAAVDTWTMITNATNDLWGGLEAVGLTLSDDIMTVQHGGDYMGSLSMTFSGLNGKDFQVRVYNITQSTQLGYVIGATTTGANNYTNVTLPLYLECEAGDRLRMEVQCTTDGSDPTFRSAVFYMAFLHN